MNVLVDTSVWSIALRKIKNNAEDEIVVKRLTELIQEFRAHMIGPIRQELLSGLSNEKTFQQLCRKLEAFDNIKIISEDYVRAAEMYNICRKKGIQGSHIDFLICAIAERNHLSIFTLDNDFKFYAKYLPIVLF